jgi:hypothetical protein
MKEKSQMKKILVVSVLAVLALAQVSWADDKDEVVKKSQDGIEASGQQLLMDVDALIKRLKEIVEKADITQGSNDIFQQQVQEHAVKILRDVEVTAVQTILGVIEKKVVENKAILEPFAMKRIVEFFKVTEDDVKKLRDKKMSWGDIVMTYGMSKATSKDVSFITNLIEQKKSWVQIAETAELKFMQLAQQLEGFLPK